MAERVSQAITHGLCAGTGILTIAIGFHLGTAFDFDSSITEIPSITQSKSLSPPAPEVVEVSDWASVIAACDTAEGKAAFLQRLAIMNADEVSELFETTNLSFPRGKRAERLYEAIFQRMAELDPAAAIEAFASIPGNSRSNHPSRKAAIRGMALGVSQSESLAIQLIHLSDQVSDSNGREEIVDEVYSNLLAGSLEVTLQMAKNVFSALKNKSGSDSDSQPEYFLSEITDNWFQQDSKSAWELALKNRDADSDEDDAYYIKELLSHLAEWNAESAIKLARQEDIVLLEETDLMERWIEQRPDAAATWIDEHTDYFSTEELVTGWIASGYPMSIVLERMDETLFENESVSGALSIWSSRSPDAFRNWLDLKPDAETKRLLQSTLENATKAPVINFSHASSSPNALSYYLTRFGDMVDPNVISTAVNGIDASTFPAEIAQLHEMAAKMPDGPVRTALEDSLALKQLRENPEKLFDLVNRGAFPNNDNLGQDALRQFVDSVTRESIDAIWGYAERVPESLQHAFYTEVFRTQQNRTESENQVAALLSTIAASSSEKEANEIGAQVAKQFANNGKWELAAHWANSTASESAAKAAMEISIKQWAEESPNAVAEWITAADISNDLRDIAIAEFVPQLADDPESALRWSATMEDTEERISAATKIVKTWRELDPARVQNALAHSGLNAVDALKVAEESGLIQSREKENQNE
ncbi:MAG: hypothetical protein ACI9R3_003118 [Verrucomicrobiales bacterium]|jgi:hypothetical protein